jgi:hypothetical protein
MREEEKIIAEKKKIEEEKKIEELRKRRKNKIKDFKKYSRINIPFYLEDNEDIYDLNEPYGYFDVKIKNEIDKQENYFSVKRYKLTIDY